MPRTGLRCAVCKKFFRPSRSTVKTCSPECQAVRKRERHVENRGRSQSRTKHITDEERAAWAPMEAE